MCLGKKSKGWFVEFMATPRQLSHPELFTDIISNPSKSLQTKEDQPSTDQEVFFSTRKQFLAWLSEKGRVYKLKQPKGIGRRPPELQTAIPIVSM